MISGLVLSWGGRGGGAGRVQGFGGRFGFRVFGVQGGRAQCRRAVGISGFRHSSRFVRSTVLKMWLSEENQRIW